MTVPFWLPDYLGAIAAGVLVGFLLGCWRGMQMPRPCPGCRAEWAAESEP